MSTATVRLYPRMSTVDGVVTEPASVPCRACRPPACRRAVTPALNSLSTLDLLTLLLSYRAVSVVHVIERGELPAGLAQMPADAGLAAVLASVDRAGLTGDDLLTVVQARWRLIAHVQAQLLADIEELAFRDPDGSPGRTTSVNEHVVDELGFAMRWTGQAAGGWLHRALMVTTHPAVFTALDRGVIDVPRAQVIIDGVTVLDDAAATSVIGQVIDQAPGWTTGQLRARLGRLVERVDPAAGKNRLDESVADRRVVCERDPDGTASIFGLQLPPDKAVAACERVDGFARAAKQAGDGRGLDQLRADIFLDILTGQQGGPGPVHRRGVVELTVPLETLLGLAEQPGELAGFGAVVADTARHIADGYKGDGDWSVTVHHTDGAVVHHRRLRRHPTSGGFGSTTVPDTDDTDCVVRHRRPRRRHPTAEQARFVRARDRTCRAPGCRAPARRCDIDHTTDYAHGGLSTGNTLGCLCRRHHPLKHTYGWKLRQIAPGVFIWYPPFGRVYTVEPDPP